jgi:hypothetical protein
MHLIFATTLSWVFGVRIVYHYHLHFLYYLVQVLYKYKYDNRLSDKPEHEPFIPRTIHTLRLDKERIA